MTETKDTGLLWAGEFGDEYIKRNSNLPPRDQFWNMIAHRYRGVESVLECGCNIGHNLRYIKQAYPRADLFGMDVNDNALAIMRVQVPGVTAIEGDIRDIPLDDRQFDLVFSIGVLIHLTNDDDLASGIKEMFRVSNKYVLISEYWSPNWEMIPYHGISNALRKGPFEKMVQSVMPRAQIVGAGPMDESKGFDWGMHWWVYSAS